MINKFASRPFACNRIAQLILILGLIVTGFGGDRVASAQTLSTGALGGIVTDSTGAVVPNAEVRVTEPTTGFEKVFVTSSGGTYSVTGLAAGNYVIHVSAPGFASTDEPVIVQVGITANGSVKLGVGGGTTVVEVQGSAVEVDTQQSEVSGVLSREEIANLPLNGRNFLDLAQLQPGVQIQDGTNFDPTKNGFSSISFGGRYGRTARISVDGLDISDENVGTTTQNISEDAIQEFQVAQSNLDISTSITSSGSVNIITRTGTNKLHGDGFYNFRDKRAGGANFPGGQDNYLQRNNVGGALGGAIKPDKAFYFLSAENFTQHLDAPVSLAGTPLAPLSGSYTSPFLETELLGRTDFNLPKGMRAFLRGSYHGNRDTGGFGGGDNFSPYLNQNNTRDVAGGLDFVNGAFTHSIRLGYFKFVNHITDATKGTGIYNPAPEVNIAIGSFSSGSNLLAPQTTIQSNRQYRYDGSWTKAAHTVRYGFSYTRIYGGGFASFFGLAPQVQSSYDPATAAIAATGPFAGGDANPLNYPLGFSQGQQSLGAILGNGQGYSTSISNFGFPGGGLFDSRAAAYLGDTWKVLPRLNVNYGLRYIHDTGRSDSNLPPVSLLSNIPGLDPSLGNKIHQPGSNFGPQAGLAYDVTGKGKTVLRAGAGIYYENNVWNNIYFDAPARLQSGLFFGDTTICPNGSVRFPTGATVSSVDGLDIATQVCGQPIGNVAQAVADLQTEYQAATVQAGPQGNGSYIGNTYTESADGTGDIPFYPGYKTPVSYQMNIGIQQEVAKNFVVTADYVRNTNVHALLGIDENHVGDARYLNVANAQAAIAATLAACGAASIDASIQNCPNLGRPAVIQDYASNGLDSEYTGAYGFPGTGFAFDGINPTFGTLEFLKPVGKSNYNALQVSAHEHAVNPVKFVTASDLTVAYTYSHFNSTGKDQDFGGTATDYNNPTKFIGPNGLDRRQQFSVSLDVATYKGIHVATIAHLYSSLPITLALPTQGAGDIFIDDFTGDGTVGDILPGNNVGAYMRKFGPGGLNRAISAYNNTYAGKPTPAGQALVSAGLLTSTQLTQLGGVLESVAPAPAGTVGNDILRIWDVDVSYPIKVGEGGLVIEPSVHAFNILNAANFDAPGTAGQSNINGVLNGAAGSANNNTGSINNLYRIGLGTGVYSFGAPRQLEFGLKATF